MRRNFQFRGQEVYYCQNLILEDLLEIQCSEITLRNIYDIIISNKKNIGLTITNPYNKEILVLISKSKNSSKFFDIFIRELNNVSNIITSDLRLDYDINYNYYLTNELGKELFKTINNYI